MAFFDPQKEENDSIASKNEAKTLPTDHTSDLKHLCQNRYHSCEKINDLHSLRELSRKIAYVETSACSRQRRRQKPMWPWNRVNLILYLIRKTHREPKVLKYHFMRQNRGTWRRHIIP